MRTFFIPEMHFFLRGHLVGFGAMSQSAVICLRRDIVFDSDETLSNIKKP